MHLPAVNVACRPDGHDVRVCGEDLVEDGAMELAVGVFVEVEAHNVFNGQWLPRHGVAVELFYVRQDVQEIVHGAIQRASLQINFNISVMKFRGGVM